MKASLNWLKEYTDISSTPWETAEKLTMAGLEVEAFSQMYDYLDHVVVGKIQKITPHPRADRLSCCRVDVGDRQVDIVCGAPNVSEGDNFPCALPGAVLPGDFKIKKSRLRGEVSEGMLCSAAELNINGDASGIMLLDRILMPGTPLAEALDLSDWLFEIDLTPNRPDCLSMIGVARETAAFQKKRPALLLPEAALPTDEDIAKGGAIEDFISIETADPDLCPRYTAGLLFDVKVGPSPFWLRHRLESIGMTPVNNIVDITNFVMMETGQPLHAFDYDLLAKGKIRVKRAGKTMSFTTLDEKAHTLEPDMLMICDGERPVAIAGVMGGVNSEITEGTTRVLVESACFNPVSIRKTAKRANIATDASHRFERGVDPMGTKNALARAMSLMADLSEANPARGIIDLQPVEHRPVDIQLDTEILNRRLGTDLSPDAAEDILTSVGFSVTGTRDTVLTVRVPSFRVDVLRPEDLFEEVARLYGYNNIKTTFPCVPAKRAPLSLNIRFRDRVKDILTGIGFSEAVNYSFTFFDACNDLNLASTDVKRHQETILNPISEDMSLLRTTLVPGLLQNMKLNLSKQTSTITLFETGNVFFARQPGTQPLEKEMLAGIWTGEARSASWHCKKRECDFYDIKGVVEGLVNALGIKDFEFTRAPENQYPYLKKGYSALIKKGETVIGSLGKVDEKVLNAFSLKQDAFIFDIEIDRLREASPETISSSPLPKFPSISRDITIIVDPDIFAGSVEAEIKKIKEKEPLIEDVFLFDLYQKSNTEKKSLSYRVVYRSFEKTLKEKKIKGLHARISKILVDKFNADLPS
ncbi:MAG: phenylalanine--tRNA ligase subunit beta [Thermodesulfobacteriota bacterium]|nr:phenylalanine--tRNA ligase subunit beta [Thermodesulfobacteriota bacterium]